MQNRESIDQTTMNDMHELAKCVERPKLTVPTKYPKILKTWEVEAFFGNRSSVSKDFFECNCSNCFSKSVLFQIIFLTYLFQIESFEMTNKLVFFSFFDM
ncbi:hypothetical protein BpHYR1_049426 [Brachionus plicatilis]|uniref:Uncharacterized protein n=1 Tax=Brachionus plicatilis TaxID=10195 RepID=A0A3M7QIC5_BRAPC|nr:hypothetical protein BpHYR1_049426 [Brachionus plicatilis]